MKILEIISGGSINGAVRHCLLLSRAFAERGHAVTLVCRPDADFVEQLAGEPFEVVTSNLRRWPTDELRRMAALARARQIDVIHTHMSRANFFGVLLRYASGIPCVATAHSRHFQLHWRFNDLVIAVSEATRRFHRRLNLVPLRRIVTIHNFIDEHRLARVPGGARAGVRRELGVDQDSPLLGIVGDIIRRKGLLYLVRAMPEILAAQPRTRLAIVGRQPRGNYHHLVRREAERLKVDSHLIWLGERNDVPEILQALDLWVLPSIEESLPLAILEAMGSGLPVVATTVGGIPECVQSDRTGTLVPPGDAHALARAILDLLANPARRAEYGACARQRMRDEFSLHAQTARIEAALESAAQRRRAA